MIDLGKAEVLKRQMAKAIHCIVRTQFALPDLVKKFSNRFGVQISSRNLHMPVTVQISIEEQLNERALPPCFERPESRLCMRYDFLIETYASERIKVVSVWAEFRDEDLEMRPNSKDVRGRSVREQMVHQCVSEDLWFRNMLGIDVGASPLPGSETRMEFISKYVEFSGKRLTALEGKDENWWEGETQFFDVKRSRAWVMTRRLTHTSHHRGQQMAMLRMLGHALHSNYGPTADTGGLMQNQAPTIYAYPELRALLEGEAVGGRKAPLPGPGEEPVTERPLRK
jgi:uncharacterized damage-inducible protein DinB